MTFLAICLYLLLKSRYVDLQQCVLLGQLLLHEIIITKHELRTTLYLHTKLPSFLAFPFRLPYNPHFRMNLFKNAFSSPKNDQLNRSLLQLYDDVKHWD